jgi:hypothetical protein
VSHGRLVLLVLVLGLGLVAPDFLCLCLCLEVSRFRGCLVDGFELARSSWISTSIFLAVDRDHVRCPCLCSVGAAVGVDSDLRGFVVWSVLQSGLFAQSCGLLVRTMVGASFDSKMTVDVLSLNRTDLRFGSSVGFNVLEPDEGLRADFCSCPVRVLCLEVRTSSSRLLDDLCLCLRLCLGLGLVVLCVAGGLPAQHDHRGCFLAVLLPPPIHPGVIYFLLATSAGIFATLLPHLVLRVHFPLSAAERFFSSSFCSFFAFASAFISDRVFSISVEPSLTAKEYNVSKMW